MNIVLLIGVVVNVIFMVFHMIPILFSSDISVQLQCIGGLLFHGILLMSTILMAGNRE